MNLASRLKAAQPVLIALLIAILMHLGLTASTLILQPTITGLPLLTMGMVLTLVPWLIGTAFLACEESNAAPGHRAALLSASRGDTVLTRAFSGRLARGLRNRLADYLKKMGIPVHHARDRGVFRSASIVKPMPRANSCAPFPTSRWWSV